MAFTELHHSPASSNRQSARELRGLQQLTAMPLPHSVVGGKLHQQPPASGMQPLTTSYNVKIFPAPATWQQPHGPRALQT